MLISLKARGRMNSMLSRKYRSNSVVMPFLILTTVATARAQPTPYPNTAPMPGWMNSAFQAGVADEPIPNPRAGQPGQPQNIPVSPGTNGACGPGATYPDLGGQPNEVGIDVKQIANLAGINTGPTPSDAEDESQLRELVGHVLRHERGHVNGTTPPNSDVCGHARNRRDGLPILCGEICYRKSHGLKKDKMCNFYQKMQKDINSKLQKCPAPSPGSPPEPTAPDCKDSSGNKCCRVTPSMNQRCRMPRMAGGGSVSLHEAWSTS